jgi:hypothetical protein
MTWEKWRNQLGQMTRKYSRPAYTKNGPVEFYHKLFLRLGWKPYISVSTFSNAQRSSGFWTLLCVSPLSLSLSIKFLFVTLVLHPIILESVLKARTH